VSTFTDSMPPGSVFVPPVIVERRWKYTRFLLILGAIIAATGIFTPYEHMSTWEFITPMAIASLTWVVAFLIRLLYLDRSHVVNDPRPPWFEASGDSIKQFLCDFVFWFFAAILIAITIRYYETVEPASPVPVFVLVALAVLMLALGFKIITIVSPRLKATRLGSLVNRYVP
jgi:hypothetical protein